MKKQAYSAPQMRVVRMRMSRSVLLSASSNINKINSVDNNNKSIGIDWGGADDSEEAI